jgi:hypothetical protein
MGQSTNGMLVYGYNLGDPDGGWEIAEADEDGAWEPDWQGDDSFTEAAEARLLASVGLTEEPWVADGYGERRRAARTRLGVEFESYCSGEYPMWLLAARTITAYRGVCKEIDFADLDRQRAEGGWDNLLAHAIGVLGITPKQATPRWLLVSYWG